MRSLFLIVFLIAPIICLGEVLSGKIIRVTDGDTVVLLTESHQQVKVRLNAIDAPEKKQAFGNRSKQALELLCDGRVATVNTQGTDRYGRTIGELFCQGVSANAYQVENGLAWVYRKYSHDAHLIALESSAKSGGIGLWGDTSPIAPWEFRHGAKD